MLLTFRESPARDIELLFPVRGYVPLFSHTVSTVAFNNSVALQVLERTPDGLLRVAGTCCDLSNCERIRQLQERFERYPPNRWNAIEPNFHNQFSCALGCYADHLRAQHELHE